MKAFRLAAKKGKARKAGATQGQEVESRAGCRRYQEHEAESGRMPALPRAINGKPRLVTLPLRWTGFR